MIVALVRMSALSRRRNPSKMNPSKMNIRELEGPGESPALLTESDEIFCCGESYGVYGFKR